MNFIEVNDIKGKVLNHEGKTRKITEQRVFPLNG